ncbi:MAG: DedA family protein [Calditrichaeota bacterium]|nr:DedA family protein [Calditrichota bacterium]
MLNFLPEFFDKIDPLLAYGILFVSAFVENVFPPIPGDTVTVFGAYLVSTGKLEFWGVYLSTTLGSVLGFFAMYVIGLKAGTQILNSRWIKKAFDDEKADRVKKWFAKYGYWVIAVNRFLSGTRSIVSLFSGFFALRWFWVLLLSLLSALLWNGILIYGGYLLGVNWEKIAFILKEYNKIVLIVIAVGVILFLIYRYFRKRRRVE